jgi:hypothetical protein
MKGNGISEIIISAKWYCKTQKEEDVFGIAINK